MSNNMDPPPELDRRPIRWSYTFLNTYENICPYQAYRKYIRRDIPYVESAAAKRGNDVHAALEHRIGGGKPLPPDMPYEKYAVLFDGRGVKPEQKLGVTVNGHPCGFFDGNVWLRGKVDVPVVNGTTAYIADWKTGREWEQPYELKVGAVLLHAANPKLTKIVGQYVWLKEDKLGPLHDLSDTSKTWAHIQAVTSQIYMDKSKDQFEKREGPLCAYCDVLDCEKNRKKAAV